MNNDFNLRATDRPGFSLIELLVSMAVIGMLAALSLPAVSNLANGNEMNRSLVTIAGVFGEARQYAIAKNTYVWVLFSGNPGVGEPVKVARMASTDGRDTFSWSTSPVDLSNSTNASLYQSIGRVLDLRRVAIKDFSENYPTAQKLQLLSPSAAQTKMMAPVQVTGVAGASAVTFTRAILFTPTGEARVNGSSVRYVDFTVIPDVGSDANQSVLRVAGLTGKTTVYRNN